MGTRSRGLMTLVILLYSRTFVMHSPALDAILPCMDRASVPNMDHLDRDGLVELVRTHQEKLASLMVARDEEIRRLEA
jgi:hypothetical protein